ncbi:MAG: MFS transporter [Desulfobacter sp.]
MNTETNALAPPQKDIVRRTMIAISIIFAGYIAINYGFAIDLFSMVVPDMKTEIGFSYTAVGTISAFVRGGFLTASLMSIFLIPRIGSGRVVFLSVVVCTACFWGMASARTPLAVGAFMTLIGACAATVYIPMVDIVGRFIPKKYHGRVIGFICGGQSIGVMAASVMVPYVVTHYTWRWAWMAVGTIAAAVLVVSGILLRRIGVFAHPDTDTPGPSPATASSPGRLRTILTPGTILVMLLYFLSAFCYNPFQTYLSPYFRDELGFSVETATLIWSCIALPGVVSGLFMGYIADRFSICVSLVIAYGATVLATLVLIFFPGSGLLPVAGLLFGLAFYSVFGLIPAYISKVNTPSVGVKVFALANIVHGAGGISGNFLGGWLKDATGTFVWLYSLITAALVLLVVFTLFLPNEKKAG